MKEFVSLVRSLIDGLDLRGRWLTIVGLFASAIIILVVFELITGWNYYNNLEKRIDLLDQLYKLSQEGIKSDPDLAPIYYETVNHLKSKTIFSPRLPKIGFQPSVNFWKWITGGSFWFFTALLGPFGVFGDENRVLSLVALSIIGITFGYIGTLIPTIHKPWINYVFYPLFQIILLVLVSQRASKAKEVS